MPTFDMLSPNGLEVSGLRELVVSAELNALGSFSFQTPGDSASEDLFGVQNLVDLRLGRAGGTPVELGTYRMLNANRNRATNALGQTDVQSWTGEPNVSWLLRKTMVGGAYTNNPEERDHRARFTDVNPGQLWVVIITLRRLYGGYLPVDQFSFDFTTTHDSNGDPWGDSTVIEYRVYNQGDSLVDVLDDGVEMGKYEWLVENNTLRLFNPGTGVDRSALPADAGYLCIYPTQIDKEAYETRSGTDAATSCHAYGVPTVQVRVDLSADYHSSVAHTACSIDVPEVSNVGILTRMATNEIRRRMLGSSGKGTMAQQSVKLKLDAEDQPCPALAFNLRDIVDVQMGGNPTALRVGHWMLTRGTDGLSAGIVFGERLSARQARLARIQRQLERLARFNRVA